MSIVKQFKGNKILSSAEFVALFRKYDKDGMYVYKSSPPTHFPIFKVFNPADISPKSYFFLNE